MIHSNLVADQRKIHVWKFGIRLQWICQTFHVRRFPYSIFLPYGWNWKILASFQPNRYFSACMLFSIAASAIFAWNITDPMWRLLHVAFWPQIASLH
jgi:hypothetical protein